LRKGEKMRNVDKKVHSKERITNQNLRPDRGNSK
jgi:hypothetical protein